MLVYDLTQRKSFENINKWIRNIDEVHNNTKIIWYLTNEVFQFY